MDSFDELKKLWNDFRKLPFPSKLIGEYVKEIDLTSLDTFTAGCIDTFISRKGSLDNKKQAILEKCRTELEIVIKELDGEAEIYYEKLLNLATETLKFLHLT